MSTSVGSTYPKRDFVLDEFVHLIIGLVLLALPWGPDMPEDSELERIKLRRMQEMQRRLREQEKEKTTDQKQPRPRDVLKTVLVGRAWEVLDAAAAQFPEPTRALEAELARLVREGRLKGPVTAEQLLYLFRTLGLDVRLETKIQVFESGEMKSLADKFRGG